MITNSIAVGIADVKIGDSSSVSTFTIKDVSNFVRSVNIKRGKTTAFSKLPTSTATVEFNNHDRTFDPTVDAEKYLRDPVLGESGTWNPSVYTKFRRIAYIAVGQIEYFEVGGETVALVDGLEIFTGYTADWSYSYTPDGDSIAQLTLHDTAGLLPSIEMDAETPSEELSGVRYERLFDEYKVAGLYSADIDEGIATLGTQSISEGTKISDYLNTIEQTEGGLAFVDRTGRHSFNQRIKDSRRRTTRFAVGELSQRLLQLGPPVEIPTKTGPVTPARIDMSSIQTDFGTELLYNRFIGQNEGGSQVVVEDTDSVANNGKRNLELTGLLGSNDDQVTDLGTNILEKYSVPKLRFSQVEVSMAKYDSGEVDGGGNYILSEQQGDLLVTDLGFSARVAFTPNNTGDEIVQYKEIIGIQHSITPNDYRISFTLDDLRHRTLILDDIVFGKLDENQLG